MKSNIIITGFMGTGKSAVAKELARKLKMEFIDMDRIIEERRGMSIADVFAGHGEKYFREQENKLVKELSKKENTVIATGGGTLLSSDNARMLGQRGQIICLYADSQTIYNLSLIHISEPTRLGMISYAVFCLKKKKKK